jgi:hypothetical protein
MRLVGDISWQESDQLDNFDRRLKFLEISLTKYIEKKGNTQSFSSIASIQQCSARGQSSSEVGEGTQVTAV